MLFVENYVNQERTRQSPCDFWFYSLVDKVATEQVNTRTFQFYKGKIKWATWAFKMFLLFLLHSTYCFFLCTFPFMSIPLQSGLLIYLTFTKHITLFHNCVFFSTRMPYQILKHVGKIEPDTMRFLWFLLYSLNTSILILVTLYVIITLCVCLSLLPGC